MVLFIDLKTIVEKVLIERSPQPQLCFSEIRSLFPQNLEKRAIVAKVHILRSHLTLVLIENSLH
ncbi:hypothetical protein NIES2119_16920 [[Phormidium ambiguum] IAM M-71]|uniref:Uncharacterized protein n=1 Tax=[Phormidium ambiguum] IAM M-71 TaxID=454136 RepID=A0A1U7II13_9CYAN|nr:hypothetical protein [Phormidium ambiguum]OKH36706.1 hypothetical protein NIES2119_16920 [Phormidium ambiguum IAM M-71]